MALYPRDDEITFVFYRYDPSLVGAIIFASLFGASTGLLLYQMVRTKTWYFIPFFIGGICKCPPFYTSDLVVETVGYIGRAISHFNSTALIPYIMQSLLLLLAPALFAASIYMSFGRLIHFVHAEHHSVIRTDRITKLFVCGDVLSFVIQGTGMHYSNSISYGRELILSGGGIMATGTISSYHTGQYIIVAGLFMQLLFFGIFMITAVVFYRRITKYPTPQSSQSLARGRFSWRSLLFALFVTGLAIFVRSIFRVVEYLNGNGGYIQSHEVFAYVFDGVLMLVVMLLMNVFYPGYILRKSDEDWPLEPRDRIDLGDEFAKP
jgi:RTA1 like protein